MEKSWTSHISAKSRTAIAILGVLPGLNNVMLLQSNDPLIFLASFFYKISMQANCSCLLASVTQTCKPEK